jgi:NAD(P)-dependent dehydrogenase (short-subunit alcohol dehydrogenase family)
MTAPSRITTGFGAQSTAAEVVSGVDLTGKRAIVTGGASGIGVETARALASAGAEVTLAVRNLVAGQETAEDIIASTDNKAVYVAALELADPASVRSFVAGWSGPLHILVNNAGVMAPPLTRTPQGWEIQFATNHLGHFGLVTGLHPALAAAGGARVVSVSSTGHLRSSLRWDDIHFDTTPYEPWTGYGQSKTSNILLAVEIATRWAGEGIVANALHPGGIRTALQRHITEEDLQRMLRTAPAGTSWKNVEQGAATSVLLAASPVVDGVTGRYFEDCNEAEPNTDPAVRRGVAGYALDPENASRLWAVSTAHLASVR